MSHDDRSTTRAWQIPDELRWGVGLAFGTALISGFAIFVNAFAVKQLPDAAVYTTLKNGVAAAILVGLAALSVRPAEIRALDRRSWAGLVSVGIVGGSLPFLLFFNGLAMASAPSAAFIHKTLFVWVALLAVPVLGERLGAVQLAALGVLVAGLALASPPSGLSWGSGETLIAAATLLWAVEAVLARRLLRRVPSAVLAAGRLGVGLVVLVGYLAVTDRLASVAALSAGQWAWVVGTGAILAGYVATWFAALRRAPASLVSAILVFGAPVTAALGVISGGPAPVSQAIVGQVAITAAVLALAAFILRSRRSAPIRA